MLEIFKLAFAFVLGGGCTVIAAAIWAKHNRKKLEKALNFFDVQARIDELLAKTEIDDKLKEFIKEIRDKIDDLVK